MGDRLQIETMGKIFPILTQPHLEASESSSMKPALFSVMSLTCYSAVKTSFQAHLLSSTVSDVFGF